MPTLIGNFLIVGVLLETRQAKSLVPFPWASSTRFVQVVFSIQKTRV